MSNQPQTFLADSALQAAVTLEAALKRLPEDKRNWSAMGNARSAMNMIAECAILNGNTAGLIVSRQFTTDFGAYLKERDELAQDEVAALVLLKENVAKVADAIREVSDEDLEVEVQMPWGPMTLEQVISYPFWNMSYHEGQINFIASMLGCLE